MERVVSGVWQIGAELRDAVHRFSSVEAAQGSNTNTSSGKFSTVLVSLYDHLENYLFRFVNAFSVSI